MVTRAAVGLDGEHGARLHGASVERGRCTRRTASVAADLRAGEPEPLADEVREQRPRLDLRLVPGAVDGDEQSLGNGTSFSWRVELTLPHPYDVDVAFQSVAEVERALAGADYLPDRGLATAVFLALPMRRPLLLEGEPGVGQDRGRQGARARRSAPS